MAGAPRGGPPIDCRRRRIDFRAALSSSELVRTSAGGGGQPGNGDSDSGTAARDENTGDGGTAQGSGMRD